LCWLSTKELVVATVKRFEELECWKEAREFALQVIYGPETEKS